MEPPSRLNVNFERKHSFMKGFLPSRVYCSLSRSVVTYMTIYSYSDPNRKTSSVVRKNVIILP